MTAESGIINAPKKDIYIYCLSSLLLLYAIKITIHIPHSVDESVFHPVLFLHS